MPTFIVARHLTRHFDHFINVDHVVALKKIPLPLAEFEKGTSPEMLVTLTTDDNSSGEYLVKQSDVERWVK